MGTLSRYIGVPIGKKTHFRRSFNREKEQNGNNIQICWCSNMKKKTLLEEFLLGEKIMETIFRYVCVPIGKKHINGGDTIGRNNSMGRISTGKKPINGGFFIGRKNRMGTISRYVVVPIGKNTINGGV